MLMGDLRARAANGGRVSLALVLSYAFDWLILIGAVAVGGVLSFISPNKRPFALNDSKISFPFVEHEKVPAFSLFLIGGIGPVVIIAIIAIFLVPGPTVPKSTPKSLIWRRKLWELHTGWLGLGLSLAAAFLITQGMKNLFGKPRPDLLNRCEPNLKEKEKFVLGGFATVDPAFLVYSAAICMSQDKEKLDDGFRSFPSGHASFSSSGLIYLSLFIASKLAITIPFLPANAYTADEFVAFPSRMKSSSRVNMNDTRSTSNDSLEEAATDQRIVAARNLAAAPPLYLLVFAIIPFFGSVYIASTRFSDFRHHGFDILFGYTIGVVTAVFAFRYYHLPISKGAGWSWGPRSKDRSFWAGVGVGNYVGDRGRRATQLKGPRGSPPRTESGMTEVDLERANSFEHPSSHDVGNGGHSHQFRQAKESNH